MSVLRSRHLVAAGMGWVLVTALLAAALLGDHIWLKVIAGLCGAAYLIGLVVWLARTGRADAAGTGHGWGQYLTRVLLCLGVLLAVVVAGLAVGTAAALIGASAVAAVVVMVVRRHEVVGREVAWGVVAGLVAAAAIVLFGNRDWSWAAFVLVTTPPLFVAGAVLRRRTGIGAVRVLDHQYARAARGLATGAMVAVPLALSNLFGGVQAGDDWVVHWWQPAAAIEPAVFEEVWAQLFLLSLVYAVLHKTGRRRAVVTAIVFSALAHGLAHSGVNLIGMVIGSVIYAVPAAILFVQRDLEHAVGYHFTIDFVRYIAAYMAPL